MVRPSSRAIAFRALCLCVLLPLGGFHLLQNADLTRTAQTARLPRPAPAVDLIDEYGLRTNGLTTEARPIARHETFSRILAGYHVDAAAAQRLAEAAAPVFDVRTLQEGKQLRAYSRGDRLQYLVYAQNPVDYVVFDLRDSLRVSAGQRPVKNVVRELRGYISGSFYSALKDLDADPELIDKLSDVLAWQVDFYEVQKGDNFAIVFEERRLDGAPVGLGDIKAVRFNHKGEDFYAFQFGYEDQSGYYDQQGRSLKTAFLKSPLKYAVVTSEFSASRFHPVQKRYKPHLGTDYAAPKGTPIYAVADGRITEAGFQRYNGNYVKIEHDRVYATGYLHMSRIAPGMKPGRQVRQGEVIGYVGATGLATGPHVCFRFWKNGEQVNSRAEKLPAAAPIPLKYRPDFIAYRDQMLPRLEMTPKRRIFAAASLEDLPS